MAVEDSAELRAIVERWDKLPEAFQAGFVAMVRAASGDTG